MTRARPRVSTRDYATRQVKRSYQLAGPVVQVETLRCDCGTWLRPGVDHECAHDPRPRHAVTFGHAGQIVLSCACGWEKECAPRTPASTASRMAAAHVRRSAAERAAALN